MKIIDAGTAAKFKVLESEYMDVLCEAVDPEDCLMAGSVNVKTVVWQNQLIVFHDLRGLTLKDARHLLTC